MMKVTMKTALSIAGSDSSGGAGIQADIKTMSAHGIYAMTAVTALTAQNTCGVKSILESTPEFLENQLDAVFSDIFPDAVKIGMVSSAQLIRVIAQKLKQYDAKKIVLDPVMVATSGSRLMRNEALEALKSELFPLADVITPNIPEAEVLVGERIKNSEDMEKAAKSLYAAYNCAVLLKGGHGTDKGSDVLCRNGVCTWFKGIPIENPNTHGTGCTLSSAIASNLAKNMELEAAIKAAKDYITGALLAMLDLGEGSGPLNHLYDLRSEYINAEG